MRVNGLQSDTVSMFRPGVAKSSLFINNIFVCQQICEMKADVSLVHVYNKVSVC